MSAPIALEFLSRFLIAYGAGVATWRRFLWEVYRVRYSLTCWISIAFLIKSLDHSLSVRLISYRGYINKPLAIRVDAPWEIRWSLRAMDIAERDYGIAPSLVGMDTYCALQRRCNYRVPLPGTIAVADILVQSGIAGLYLTSLPCYHDEESRHLIGDLKTELHHDVQHDFSYIKSLVETHDTIWYDDIMMSLFDKKVIV